MRLINSLKNYIPYNEQEAVDKINMIKFLETGEHVFTRENELAHMTASAWVVNKKKDKVLMVYHNIYHSWSWTGGHADGEEDLLKVAMKEVMEETGIHSLKPLKEDIFSIEVLHVEGHEKRGKYVASHLHMNVTYLLEADDEEPLMVKADENSGVIWFGLHESVDVCTEPFMAERIYSKLIEKLHHL